jgi:hypothetical protein
VGFTNFLPKMALYFMKSTWYPISIAQDQKIDP